MQPPICAYQFVENWTSISTRLVGKKIRKTWPFPWRNGAGTDTFRPPLFSSLLFSSPVLLTFDDLPALAEHPGRVQDEQGAGHARVVVLEDVADAPRVRHRFLAACGTNAPTRAHAGCRGTVGTTKKCVGEHASSARTPATQCHKHNLMYVPHVTHASSDAFS